MNIRYSNVCKNYKGQEVLKNMSLFIPEGSIFFLLGLNGAGKTTMMKIALGMVETDSGECEFNYNDNDNGIGAIIETPTFFEKMNAYENLKYYDGLETVYANMDLKISDLEQKASKRDDVVQKLEDNYVSAANSKQPLMFTV